MATDYSQYVSAAAKKYGVPEKLVHQLISVESSGNANATSPTGPRGLMQVSGAVAKEAGYTKEDMYDPEKNIDAGVKYLAQNLKAFDGNVPQALLGYNQGTGGAKQMLSGKKAMAEEGWNYIHNKKFSPEYLSKDSKVVPSYTDYMTPNTDAMIAMGREGVNPTPDDQYTTSAMFNSTPEEAQDPTDGQPVETEIQKKLKESQQYADLKNKMQAAPAPQQQIQAPSLQAPQPQQLNMALFSSRLQQPQTQRPQGLPQLANLIGGSK